MGFGFVFATSAVFTTVIIYLYLSVADQENGLNQMKTSETFYQTCNIDESYHIPRIREDFMLEMAKDLPTKILKFNRIPTLYRKRNKAKFINGIGQCIRICNDPNRLVLVTNVISLLDHYRTLEYLKRLPTTHEMDGRFLEVLNTLQTNLNHPQFKTISVLVESRTMAQILTSLDFENSQKLVIHNVEGELSMMHSITYATKCFRDETVVIANGDVTFGDGWQNLDYQYLRENKHIYALTRHDSKLNPGCKGNTKFGICQGLYRISHDAFVFHVKEMIDNESLSILDGQLYNVRGVENVLIWILRERFHYKVTNPCSLLKIHHEHCVQIRNSRGLKTRVGNKTIWGKAEFIDTLY